MRTTPSRFNGYIGQIDPNLEGLPQPASRTTQAAPVSRPAVAKPPEAHSQLSILERRHPAVIQSLRLLWGFPELNQYFEKVYSGRDSSLNLAPDAMAELMLLASVHRHICPHRPAAAVDEVYGGGRWADPWKPARLRR